MRHRVSWLILVVVAALALSWLASPITSRAQDDPTGLAVTPCRITARPTATGDPRVQFDATVEFGRGRYPRMRAAGKAKAPVLTAEFVALPSGARVYSKRFTGSFRTEFHVPDGTKEIGVRLKSNGYVDPTIPATKDNLGRYPIGAKSPVTRTWKTYPAPQPSAKPTPRY